MSPAFLTFPSPHPTPRSPLPQSGLMMWISLNPSSLLLPRESGQWWSRVVLWWPHSLLPTPTPLSFSSTEQFLNPPHRIIHCATTPHHTFIIPSSLHPIFHLLLTPHTHTYLIWNPPQGHFAHFIISGEEWGGLWGWTVNREIIRNRPSPIPIWSNQSGPRSVNQKSFKNSSHHFPTTPYDGGC